MATFQTVEDIDAWNMARELVRNVYKLTGESPFNKDFGLRDQIRKASVSIVSNIAEGFERDGRGEFIQFLAWAKGSAGEVKSQLAIALDLGYITRDSYENGARLATRIGQMIAGLISYLRQSSIAGLKYK
jgi:four helix bundle protein